MYDDALLLHTLWGSKGGGGPGVGGVDMVEVGKYGEALQWGLSGLARGVEAWCTLKTVEERFGHLAERLALNDTCEVEEKEECIEVIGVAALLIFSQANMSGPYCVIDDVDESPFAQIETRVKAVQCDAETGMRVGGIGGNTMSDDDAWAAQQLSANGEDFVGRVYLPQYLLLAVYCFKALGGVEAPRKKVWWWWLYRVTVLQQKFLSGRSQQLRDTLMDVGAKLLREYEEDREATDAESVESSIRASLYLEMADCEVLYGHVKSAKVYVDKAALCLGVHVEMSGAMGLRTVHQVNAHAQLVLNVTLREGCNGISKVSMGSQDAVALDKLALQIDEGETDANLEKNPVNGLQTDSDVLLGGPHLMDNDGSKDISREDLNSLQQILLLHLCAITKRGSSPDGTQEWEMLAYVETAMRQKYSEFSIRSAAHMERARLELQRSRTRERALVAMEGVKTALSMDKQVQDFHFSPTLRTRYVCIKKTIMHNRKRC